MSCIQDSDRDVSPLLEAALLLAARGPLGRYGLAAPAAKSIFEATGVGRTRAYELTAQLTALLPGLERPVGRPRKKSDDSEESMAGQTPLPQDEVLDYVMAHPGCVSEDQRNRYTAAFRCFIVELRERYPSMSVEQFARAVHIPVKTLRPWLREAEHALELGSEPEPAPRTSSSLEPENGLIGEGGAQRSAPKQDIGTKHAVEPDDQKSAPASPATSARVQTVLDEYKRWGGSFVEFCQHIKKHCFIDYGRSTISNILATHGVRVPERRTKRSPDECALRKSFETFFPGAQWTGDGHEITFKLNGETFKFNLELLVDTYSDAMVGANVSGQEDSAALIRAHEDGVATTGHQPIAYLLDNRSSNHTEEVKAALSESLLIRSTKGRPQNKAHVEGAFGLFQQTVPPLEITADNPRDLVISVVILIIITWARTLNHKKRRDRGNQSRVDLYRDNPPSAEQIEHAHAELLKRHLQQEKARRTELARQHPIKRKLLEQEFDALGLVDPDGNVQLAIARYPLDSIIEGIATYKAKRDANNLPQSAGARYLLGIVRNINVHEVTSNLVDELLRLRLQAHDMLLDHLVVEHDVLHKAEPEPSGRIDLFVARALDTESLLTRQFWLRHAAEEIRATPGADHDGLTRRATRRIILNYRIPESTRHQAIRYLIRLVFPVQ